MAQHATPFTQGYISISSHNIHAISEVDIAAQYEASVSHLTARKISDTVVVKKCCMAGAREYENLEHAWSLLNGIQLDSKRVLRIPRPLRYFELAGRDEFVDSYIAMECLEGSTMEIGLEKINLSDVTEAINRIHRETAHFARTHARTQPGPLDGGFAEGFPWGENGCESRFQNIADLQHCVNKRLQFRTSLRAQRSLPLDLRNTELVFCHGDYALRNIMLLQNGDIGIVDWANAAYYPAAFELGALKYLTTTCVEHERLLVMSLLQDLKMKTTSTESDIDALCMVHQQSIQNSCK